MQQIKWCVSPFLLLIALYLPCAVQANSQNPEVIDPLYFGLHIHRATENTLWPSVPFGSWRFWDTHTTWADLEPTPGKWDFSRLDKMVDLAMDHRVDVLLVLGITPRWASARPSDFCYYGAGRSAEPKKLRDWENYVRKVGSRYKGRIRHYEIWNEPNLKGFFSGSPELMVSLAQTAYRILKEIDPENLIVSPSSGGGNEHDGPVWLDRYLKAGGGEYADIVGYHFYVIPEAPELMLPLIGKIQQIMTKHGVEGKRLWNTETGWNIVGSKNPLGRGILDESTSADYLVRSFLLNRSAGVSRFYWYAWDNAKMGLASDNGLVPKKKLISAFQQVVNWLVGARLFRCDLGEGRTWDCYLLRKNNLESHILWSDSMGYWILPSNWKGAKLSDLSGNTWKSLKRSFAVGSSPVLFEPVQ